MKKIFLVLLLSVASPAWAKDWRLGLDVTQSGQSSAKLLLSTPQLESLWNGRLGLFAGQTEFVNIKGTEKDFVRSSEYGVALNYSGQIVSVLHYHSSFKIGHARIPEVQSLSEAHKYWYTDLNSGFGIHSAPNPDASAWIDSVSVELGVGWQNNFIDREKALYVAGTLLQDDFLYPYLRLNLDL